MTPDKQFCPTCGTLMTALDPKDKPRIERFLARLNVDKKDIKICPKCGYVYYGKS